MKEEWKDIAGYEESYQVSNIGRVRSKSRDIEFKNGTVQHWEGVIKSQTKNPDGYLRVTLSKGSIKTRASIHRLVAEAFIDKIHGKNTVNHKDGNKNNNNVCNLEWCTSAENTIHAHKNNLIKYAHGEKHMWAKLTRREVSEILDLIQNTNYYQWEIGKMYSVSHSVISRIKTGTRWGRTTKGVM